MKKSQFVTTDELENIKNKNKNISSYTKNNDKITQTRGSEYLHSDSLFVENRSRILRF